MKTRERVLVRVLRREQGLSVRELAELVGVSKSSVSLWVRDIDLTEDQRAALIARNPAYSGPCGAAIANAAKFRAIRAQQQMVGREMARHADPLFVAGCMLYWAEGSKARTSAKMSNSDPEVLRFFVSFLRRHFDVPDEQFSVYCNLFADHVARQRAIERFWLDTLDLPASCLRKSIVNVYSKYSQKKRRNMLPHGTCRVAVHRSYVVQAIYGAIQEYAGFDRPEWLD